VIDGDERVAVVIPKDKGKAMLLREGDIAEGWTLVRIEVDHVVLARGEAETVLEPSYERSEPRRRNRQKNTGQNESQQ
jgi:type II secretory pathway component PulC